MAPSDGFVRLALPHEAHAIAQIQRQAFAEPGHPANAVVDQLDIDEMASVWEQAIVRPPKAEYRVLVATMADRIVGFAAVAPSGDADASPDEGEVVELVVEPAARGQGNGSRLVNAAVDTLRADRFAVATWWVLSTNDALRAFVTSVGFEPDGAHSELEGPGGERAKLIRLRCRIAD